MVSFVNLVMMSNNTKNFYFSIPSDQSFVHPTSNFPPLSIFESEVKHSALIIPAKRTTELRKDLKDVILNRPKTKSIYQVEDEDIDDPSAYRKLVLNSGSDVLEHSSIVELLKSDSQIRTSTHTMKTSYSDWTVEKVLRRLLPFKEIPSSFETIGHIAHVNLRDELLPFQLIIGKVIYDKNQPRIKTVVNKTGQIDNKYRTFGMTVIGGSSEGNWSNVRLKEEGCQFDLDFQKVYWNSRLAGEHRRLVQLIQHESPSCIVADIMAGVGPFAIPLTAAKFNITNIAVHANDLNPSSHKHLNINRKNNKCKNLHTYNIDGRAFIHHLQYQNVEFDHAIMNLPASAPEFLDAFRGFKGNTLPKIHVYCFTGKDYDAKKAAVARCEKALGCNLSNASVHLVRDVAPKKNMLCVSFTLPESAKSLTKISIPGNEYSPEDGECEPACKKIKA